MAYNIADSNRFTDERNEITTEMVQEQIDTFKVKGLIGKEVVIQIGAINSLPNQIWLYKCQVLNVNDSFHELQNSLTNQSWTVAFLLHERRFEQGDILIGSYTLETRPKHLRNLIRIVPNTLRSIPLEGDIKEKHGEQFVNALRNMFGGEDRVLGLMYESWLETTEKDIEDYEQNIRKLNKELESLHQQVEELQMKREDLKAETVDLKEAVVNLEVETVSLKGKKRDLKSQIRNIKVAFGFEEEGTLHLEKTTGELIECTGERDLYKTIQLALYHHNDENLIYEHHVIERFITALQTDQLVLLTGPSGTGKSSLVNQLGEVIDNFKIHHVAVQSSWTDVQDLLGFFNPMKKSYLPTPFLEALVQARQEKESIHIICLDEMNLAHVEYYFSSFLSVREKHPNQRYIDLYSERFYREAKSDLEAVFHKPYQEITSADIEKLSFQERQDARNKYELLFYYPAKFFIPPNVRFVGTLNMDETVKPLSPKVIDRSFIIELDHPTKLESLQEELEEDIFTGLLAFNVSRFIYPAIQEPALTIEHLDVVKQVLHYAENVSSIPNARINGRGQKHMKRYVSCLQPTKEVVDHLVCSKVLPRIQFHKHDEEKLRDFQALVQSLPDGIAKRKAERMMQGGRVIQFWG
ncbi:McrB family protein [Bacillus mycoides]|uniref:McrB family protein n=1 Tax=Bacillus mycoides TaxID=1405 RepID=UPI00119CAB8F|nr:AAA family ATPase [Bacillus mycoides]